MEQMHQPLDYYFILAGEGTFYSSCSWLYLMRCWWALYCYATATATIFLIRRNEDRLRGEAANKVQARWIRAATPHWVGCHLDEEEEEERAFRNL